MRAHEVNEELEGQRPPWCSEHGRWECEDISHDPKCQHGNLIDDGCDKCEATAEWFNDLARGNAGVEDQFGCAPASASAPFNLTAVPALADATVHTTGEGRALSVDSVECISRARESDNAVNNGGIQSAKQDSRGGSQNLLDYPVWRLSFSAYGEQMGWEVPR